MPPLISIDASSLSYPGRTGIGRCLESVLPGLAGLAAGRARLVLLSGQPVISRVALDLAKDGKLAIGASRCPSLYLWQQSGMAAQIARLRPAAHFAPDGLLPPLVRVPALILVHDLLYIRHPQTLPWHVRAVYRARALASLKKAAVALTGSRFTRDEAIRFFGPVAQKIEVAPYNGIDPGLFHPAGPGSAAADEAVLSRHGLSPGYLLSVGNLMAHKNLALVLDALALLSARGEPVPVLAMVGLGDAAALLDRLPPGFPRERARVLGYLTDAEVAALYRQALCLCFPSRYEGFGLPVVEAMASGTPVIYAAASALPETAGEAGLAVSPDDPEEMARAISSLLGDPGLGRDLAAAGLARVRDFSWEAVALAVWSALARAAALEKRP